MLCIKFEYLTDKMIKHVSDLLIKEGGFGDLQSKRYLHSCHQPKRNTKDSSYSGMV